MVVESVRDVTCLHTRDDRDPLAESRFHSAFCFLVAPEPTRRVDQPIQCDICVATIAQQRPDGDVVS